MKIELRKYQREAVNAVWEHLRTRDDNPCVVLPTGCHAIDYPILMYDGTIKKVQDVKVGDLVMGDDSTPRTVLALARGRELMAKITPNKGESFIVNANHVLSLVSTCEGKEYKSQQKGGEITNITVLDYLEKSKSWKHLRKLYRVPVEFNQEVKLPIPPHILGMLLGDGSLTSSVSLTTMDIELLQEFEEYINSIGCVARWQSKENNKALTVVASIAKKGVSNPLMELLWDLGLRGCTAKDKFIPREYLIASRQDRLELLAGLLDSDGSYSDHTLEYTTKSLELANDIVFLAKSLGFYVSIREKFSYCQTCSGWYYRIHISGDHSLIPVRRKRFLFGKRKQKKDVLRTGFTVELLPEDDFYGFTLDGNHLYVDGNFYVHHNSGKAILLAELATQAVKQWDGRVLILAHVKELLEQNAEKVKLLCPDIPVGIYSAGLKSRQTKEPIIVAGIQSVAKKACELGSFDLIIIDEVHTVSSEQDSRYNIFLNDMKIINPHVRIIGLTATPYRLSGGLICKPENFINHICYEVGVKELINQGYLSPLTCKVTKTEVDLSKLHVRAGEFVTADVAEALDRDEVTRSAVSEIIRATEDRKAVIIFAMTIDHAEHIASCINGYGHECAIVTGDTNEAERKEIVKRIKGEKVMENFFEEKKPLRYLVNVGVFTTGFDAPNIDCVVLLRATLSPGLYVQMVGRGFRLSPQTGKKDCLILDFGENMLRHGPVDSVTVRESKSKKKDDEEKDEEGNKGKFCPQCEAICENRAIRCDDCGFVFPVKIKINAASGGILSGEESYRDYDVLDVKYFIHHKKGADDSTPFTIKVEYQISLWEVKTEWICPEHSGYARLKFEKWWQDRAKLGCPMPNNVAETLEYINNGGLMKPTQITIKTVVGEKYPRIVKYKLPLEKEIMENMPINDYSADDVWSSEYHSNSPADLGVNHDWDDEIPF